MLKTKEGRGVFAVITAISIVILLVFLVTYSIGGFETATFTTAAVTIALVIAGVICILIDATIKWVDKGS